MKRLIRYIIGIFKRDKPNSICSHQPRYREYYREGCYKCWDCGKIMVE